MEENEKLDKLNEAAAIIRENKLNDFQAIKVVDEKVGTPDFSKLMEDKMTCVCGKNIPVSVLPIVNSGVLNVTYNVCPSCKKDVDELAHLVCTTCKSTVGHIYPNREPTGFEFRKGKFYHIGTCPQCNPKEKGKADIVEKVLFFRMNNIPTKSDSSYEQS